MESSDQAEGRAFLRRFGVGALAERMGIEFIEFTRERAVATMPVLGNTQPIGLLHGGAYVVLGESLGSTHAAFVAPAGTVPVGIDINATHTGSATTGEVTGVCVPIHLGRTLAVHEIVVRDDTGRRCSTIRITNLFKQLDQSNATA
ncbi:hotdog fold thioesterase [Leucobacter sp. W1153]|uniref:hotdog fold thioesterase n=1 Tax=unclassified Leucobacter TaxID=2621730 RepID=UPI003F3F56C4